MDDFIFLHLLYPSQFFPGFEIDNLPLRNSHLNWLKSFTNLDFIQISC